MKLKYKEENYFAPIIISVAFIIAAVIFGLFYYKGQALRNINVLEVTGSAKTEVQSDQAKLVISLTRNVVVSDLSSGYSQMAADLKLVEKLLSDSGINKESIVESPVSMNQNWSNDNSKEISYNLNQIITVQSDNVEMITSISKKVPSLAEQGAIAAVQSLEYYYSKLPELRISLLSEATKDAKARAQKIAEGTGKSIGSVEKASSGVVQVLPPNSIGAVSDYGNYDTSTIEKEIMVTVKASFELK